MLPHGDSSIIVGAGKISIEAYFLTDQSVNKERERLHLPAAVVEKKVGEIQTSSNNSVIKVTMDSHVLN